MNVNQPNQHGMKPTDQAQAVTQRIAWACETLDWSDVEKCSAICDGAIIAIGLLSSLAQDCLFQVKAKGGAS